MAKDVNLEDKPETANAEHRYSEEISKASRDEYGFMRSIQYQFTPEGLIDWRAMINPEYLVPNRDAFKNQEIDLKSLDVTTLEDKQLLILLAGIKDLAQIRGYSSVTYQVVENRHDYIGVQCTISWLPSYETSGKPVTFSALADAHGDNTYNFARNFLLAIAENRAFVRAVRGFLKINVTGNDELGGKNTSAQVDEVSSAADSSPSHLLDKTLREYGYTFESVKQTAIKKEMAGAALWQTSADVPPLSVMKIVAGIKEKAKKTS